MFVVRHIRSIFCMTKWALEAHTFVYKFNMIINFFLLFRIVFTVRASKFFTVVISCRRHLCENSNLKKNKKNDRKKAMIWKISCIDFNKFES